MCLEKGSMAFPAAAWACTVRFLQLCHKHYLLIRQSQDSSLSHLTKQCLYTTWRNGQTRNQMLHGRPHIGANGVNWTPLEKWIKTKKAKTCKKGEQFSMFVRFWEQSGQAGVENGAMLTTYLFRYFRMHHFIVNFSKFSSPQAARGNMRAGV